MSGRIRIALTHHIPRRECAVSARRSEGKIRQLDAAREQNEGQRGKNHSRHGDRYRRAQDARRCEARREDNKHAGNGHNARQPSRSRQPHPHPGPYLPCNDADSNTLHARSVRARPISSDVVV
jgi:hypothetical protein